MAAVLDTVPAWSRASLTDDEFTRIAGLVTRTCGIVLSLDKRVMLEGRLRRRLQAHGLESFAPYVALLGDPQRRAGELQALVDAVTTNHTAFWREPQHFEFLLEGGLEALLPEIAERPLRAWSAACSSGEEPYTLAMVLAEALPAVGEHGFTILATDISIGMLHKAARAIYREEDVAPLPARLREQHLLWARDGRDLCRVAPELRRLVRLAQLNLTDPSWQLGGPQDLIFCRNVLIYFDQATREPILRRLCQHLRPGGILCLGHADHLMGCALPLKPLRATLYQRL
jgi:chemotaxis protein methyltransferase CheR